MKKILILTIFATSLLAVSCGSRNKQQKAEQDKLTEEVMEIADIKDVSAGNWVDNEYTKMVPKPDMTVSQSAGTGFGYSVVFSGATTRDQMKAYAEKLKEAGFNVDPRTSDDSDMYTFWAKNADDWRVQLTVTSSANNLLISKPGEM